MPARAQELINKPVSKPGERSVLHGVRVALAACVAATPLMATAQVTAPTPKEQASPEVPLHPQARFPLEGWVTVRYTVKADGSTDDVRVIDVAPVGYAGERAAINAVKGWSFEPARADGEAIDWYNNVSAVVFDAPGEAAASDRFIQGYMGIVQQLQQGELEAAQTRLEGLRSNVTRLVEIGLVEMQAATVLAGTGDIPGAYAAIRRATDERLPVLEGEDLAGALLVRYDIERELGYFGDALETYDRLASLVELPEDDPIAASAAMIRQAVDSGAAIMIPGEVAREPWVHEPTWRTFSLTEVDGDVRGIELECNRRKTTLEYVADTDWSIPASWGDCIVAVDARRNTTFKLVEFPPLPE